MSHWPKHTDLIHIPYLHGTNDATLEFKKVQCGNPWPTYVSYVGSLRKGLNSLLLLPGILLCPISWPQSCIRCAVLYL